MNIANWINKKKEELNQLLERSILLNDETTKKKLEDLILKVDADAADATLPTIFHDYHKNMEDGLTVIKKHIERATKARDLQSALNKTVEAADKKKIVDKLVLLRSKNLSDRLIALMSTAKDSANLHNNTHPWSEYAASIQEKLDLLSLKPLILEKLDEIESSTDEIQNLVEDAQSKEHQEALRLYHAYLEKEVGKIIVEYEKQRSEHNNQLIDILVKKLKEFATTKKQKSNSINNFQFSLAKFREDIASMKEEAEGWWLGIKRRGEYINMVKSAFATLKSKAEDNLFSSKLTVHDLTDIKAKADQHSQILISQVLQHEKMFDTNTEQVFSSSLREKIKTLSQKIGKLKEKRVADAAQAQATQAAAEWFEVQRLKNQAQEATQEAAAAEDIKIKNELLGLVTSKYDDLINMVGTHITWINFHGRSNNKEWNDMKKSYIDLKKKEIADLGYYKTFNSEAGSKFAENFEEKLRNFTVLVTGNKKLDQQKQAQEAEAQRLEKQAQEADAAAVAAAVEKQKLSDLEWSVGNQVGEMPMTPIRNNANFLTWVFSKERPQIVCDMRHPWKFRVHNGDGKQPIYFTINQTAMKSGQSGSIYMASALYGEQPLFLGVKISNSSSESTAEIEVVSRLNNSPNVHTCSIVPVRMSDHCQSTTPFIFMAPYSRTLKEHISEMEGSMDLNDVFTIVRNLAEQAQCVNSAHTDFMYVDINIKYVMIDEAHAVRLGSLGNCKSGSNQHAEMYKCAYLFDVNGTVHGMGGYVDVKNAVRAARFQLGILVLECLKTTDGWINYALLKDEGTTVKTARISQQEKFQNAIKKCGPAFDNCFTNKDDTPPTYHELCSIMMNAKAKYDEQNRLSRAAGRTQAQALQTPTQLSRKKRPHSGKPSTRPKKTHLPADPANMKDE